MGIALFTAEQPIFDYKELVQAVHVVRGRLENWLCHSTCMSIGGWLPQLSLNRGKSGGRFRLQLLRRNSPKKINPWYGRRKNLFEEEAFHNLLGLEHRRAKRSRQSFVLMLLDLDGLLRHSGVDEIVEHMTSVASVTMRGTDVIGWYKTGSVIGALFAEVNFEKQDSISRLLHAKFVKALRDQLGIQLASKIQLTIHAFPASRDREGVVSVAELIA